MTGWIIFGSILLILIILFAQSIRVKLIYEKGAEVTVKILCFTLYRTPLDPKTAEKRKRKKAKKAEQQRKKDEKQRKKDEKQRQKAEITDKSGSEKADEAPDSAPETADSGKADKKSGHKVGKQSKKPKMKLSADMIMDYVRSASPPIKRLFKKIRIRDVYIDWLVGSDDAAKTALKYGGLCSAIYSAQEFLTTYLDTRIGEINIEADFGAEKDDIFVYLTMKLRISTLLGVALWLGVRVLKTYLKYNSKPKPAKKRKNNVKARPAASR
ncbi:MAG: DUF2953 domain-containing protein [Ruminiclostridium sp.]|nr:DUF2953 domain-containing protein [Ruminiclostridium sp.]